MRLVGEIKSEIFTLQSPEHLEQVGAQFWGKSELLSVVLNVQDMLINYTCVVCNHAGVYDWI